MQGQDGLNGIAEHQVALAQAVDLPRRPRGGWQLLTTVLVGVGAAAAAEVVGRDVLARRLAG